MGPNLYFDEKFTSTAAIDFFQNLKLARTDLSPIFLENFFVILKDVKVEIYFVKYSGNILTQCIQYNLKSVRVKCTSSESE